MLVLKVSMMEGRSVEQREQLIRRLSESAARNLGWALEDIRVIIYEIPREDWGIAGLPATRR